MKITKLSHRKVRLIDQNMIQEKLVKKVCNVVVLLRKQQKNLKIKLVTLKNKNVRNI